jgi:hypothetical protein
MRATSAYFSYILNYKTVGGIKMNTRYLRRCRCTMHSNIVVLLFLKFLIYISFLKNLRIFNQLILNMMGNAEKNQGKNRFNLENLNENVYHKFGQNN